jgi:hypothetical protein
VVAVAKRRTLLNGQTLRNAEKLSILAAAEALRWRRSTPYRDRVEADFIGKG